ncbi:MAG: HlyD family secretion protein [Opitutaceae bacterium]
MSERLPPIPTPSSQLWRQLRLQYLPVVIFAAGLAGAALLWTQWVAPPTLVGEAEAIRTELRAGQGGMLVELNTDMLQPVTAGQTLGRVVLTEPKVLAASLAVIRAEIEVLRTTTDMNFERLRLDWMSKRVELVALQSELHQAEATLARVTALHRIKLVTDEQFDQAKNARDAVEAQLTAHAELIKRLEPGLQTLETPGNRSMPAAAAEGLHAAINQKEAQLRLIEAQLSPLPLIAPIDGVVTLLYRRSGEHVTSGEPVLQISSTRAERIIGFLRQPIPLEPQPGMEVEVRTRTYLRRIGRARVVQVGQLLEPISPTLLAAMRLPVTAFPTDVGLRVHVTPPQGLTLRPGEQVDLIIKD